MKYTLNSTLERDSHAITSLELCEVRLMNNKLFPWLILIPKRSGLREWIDLERHEQHLLSDEISIVSHIFSALVTPYKLNIAALGNQVEQLHIHVIARYQEDSAWPAAVFGAGSEPYSTEEVRRMVYELKTALDSVIK